MIKLVIGFDELGLFPENGAFRFTEEYAYDKLDDFLDNQFPAWDNDIAFDLDNTEIDYENREFHIPYNPI